MTAAGTLNDNDAATIDGNYVYNWPTTSSISTTAHDTWTASYAETITLNGFTDTAALALVGNTVSFTTIGASSGGGGGGYTVSNSFVINNNDAQTATSAVTLNLSSTNASQVLISEDANFVNATWETYSTSKTGHYLPVMESKLVYVIFRVFDQ